MQAKSELSAFRLHGVMECTISSNYLFPSIAPQYCRLFLIQDGRGFLTTQGESVNEFHAARQDLLLQAVDGMSVHVTEKPLRILCIIAECRGRRLSSLAIRTKTEPRLKALLEQLALEPDSRELEIEALIEELFRGMVGELSNGNAASRRNSALLLKMMLDACYAESLRLDDFSQNLYANKFMLLREFKKQYGIAPIEYLMRRRVEEAAALLTGTTLKVWEIGNRVGISNPTFFTRAFSTRMGCTPIVYRRQHQNDSET